MNSAPTVQHVASGVARLRIGFVNVYFAGWPGSSNRSWVLVDAGLPFATRQILRAAEARFGRGSRPEAILLTHGHFDHVGTLKPLIERWDVPVYAHPRELPFLTGQADYPPPDPTVGGGAMASMACLYPRSGIDLGTHVHALPEDGGVPGLPGWRWLHTPGHTAGHVSFFREEDRTLLAGDAFVTVKQESALAVALQKQAVHGPPAYFTPDWHAARESVERLAALRPSVAATGHGAPMQGEHLRRELEALARDFEHAAVPARGRYVKRSARVEEGGDVAAPPPAASPSPCQWITAAALLAGTGAALAWARRALADD